MRIMDVVGESELLKLKGKYIRIAHKDLGSTIEIIGNIIKDKWFDYKTFFEKETDMLREKTERQLEEVYQSRKQYLNKKDCCEELHEMCRNCENYFGWKNHDYEGCRDLACFKNWLGLEYLDWVNGY